MSHFQIILLDECLDNIVPKRFGWVFPLEARLFTFTIRIKVLLSRVLVVVRKVEERLQAGEMVF